MICTKQSIIFSEVSDDCTINCTATVDGYSKTATYNLAVGKRNMVEGTDFTAPTANTQPYYENDVQELIKAGTSTIGSIYYRLGTDGTWTTDETTIKAENADNYTVYWYVEGNDNYNSYGTAENPNELTVTIAKQTICVTDVAVNDKDYDGSTDATLDYVISSLLGFNAIPTSEYTATAAFTDANAGKGKTVNVTITLNEDGNYIFEGNTRTWTGTAKGNINPADPTAPTGLTGYSGNKLSTVNLPNGWAWVNPDEQLDYHVSEYAANYTPTSGNYNSKSNVQVTVSRNVKAQKSLDVTIQGWTYGQTANAPVYQTIDNVLKEGTRYFTGTDTSGSYTATPPTDTGMYTVAVIIETLSETYAGTATFTVSKATPTGKATYTTVSEAGKTLADTALTGDFNVAGTLQWVDADGVKLADTTEVEQGTTYKWVFTPTDAANYNTVSGTVVLWARPSYSGGGSSSSGSTTVVQPTVGGTVEISNPTASVGQSVTVTPKNDEGYAIDTITVTDSNGKRLEISRNADGSFDFEQPEGEVTIEATYKQKPVLTDVVAGSWYENAVEFAVENGLFNGTDKNTFEPNMEITRGMFVTVLYNLAGKPDGEGVNFSDVESGRYFSEAVS